MENGWLSYLGVTRSPFLGVVEWEDPKSVPAEGVGRIIPEFQHRHISREKVEVILCYTIFWFKMTAIQMENDNENQRVRHITCSA